MNILKLNRKTILLAIILITMGVLLATIVFSTLNFDVSKLASHYGTWYAPITWGSGH